MNIQSYRSSFTVSILDSNLTRAKTVSDILENSGYSILHYLNEKSFALDWRQNPPHILIVNYDDTEALNKNSLGEWLGQLQAKLPEVHVITLCPEKSLTHALELYESGVYDIVAFPFQSPRQILRAVDRAAEGDYFRYLNEQLKEKVSAQAALTGESNFSLFAIWAHELFRKNEPSTGLTHLMKEISRYLAGAEVLYFKFVQSRGTLVAEQSMGLEMRLLANVGIELRTTETEFNDSHMLKPQNLKGLKELIKNGFKKKEYAAFPVIAGRDVKGTLVVIPKDGQLNVVNDPYIRLCLEAHHQLERVLGLKAKMQKTTLLDEQTEVFNRDFILRKVKEEISRARRILKPVAVLLLSIDRFHEFQLAEPITEVDKLLKSFANLFLRNSRLNDLVGRIEEDQFVLILPHTDKKGAAIKAERLRRMIESADFSKVLNKQRQFTVSIGVSEYPSICHDAEAMIQTAEDALYQVKKTGDNRVCLSSAQPNFVPDFDIKGS